MENPYRYLFGPVPSRRFGRSLGVDFTPLKTCDLDCVFCQLGRTTHQTVDRGDFVPVREVLSELRRWLKTGPGTDVITLSGSGEPTLHNHFGKVIDFVKRKSEFPCVLLTNGTLLHRKEVQSSAQKADIVKISLSAWDQISFEWINRPHGGIRFAQVMEGLTSFRKTYEGKLWMEVMVVHGMNSMPGSMKKIARLAREIRPDKIQLNVPIRPGAEEFASPPPGAHLSQLCDLFQPPAEIIEEFSAEWTEKSEADEETIFSMLLRRPCTSEQISHAFGMHLNEVLKHLGRLMRQNRIRAEYKQRNAFYVAV